MFDSKGLIHTGRTDLDERKKAFAVEGKALSLEEAFHGADVFIGLSKGNVVSQEMVKVMAPNAIVFASGHIQMKQMMKAGFVMNIISIVLIVLFCYLVLPHFLSLTAK
jgi:hypothetical protein